MWPKTGTSCQKVSHVPQIWPSINLDFLFSQWSIFKGCSAYSSFISKSSLCLLYILLLLCCIWLGKALGVWNVLYSLNLNVNKVQINTSLIFSLPVFYLFLSLYPLYPSSPNHHSLWSIKRSLKGYACSELGLHSLPWLAAVLLCTLSVESTRSLHSLSLSFQQ